ncbi:MAG: aspartate aminotransferase, partial [Halobacteria archaeon]|nr:aspartate aminotransferase [Halobacteria archaeon]
GFVKRCIQEGVIIVPGGAFGKKGEGYARISYANSRENIREAIGIMGEVLEEL